LLGVQAYLFVLFGLAVLTSTGMESLQSEMAVLAGRGASTAQIFSTYLLEGLVLALLAGVWLGPLVTQAFLLGWGQLAGVTLPSELPREARLLGLIGALCGWLVLSLTAFPAARRSVLEWQQRRARPERLASWQKGGLDLFLLVIGGLAYWQLSSAGSFVLVRLRQSDMADPLLLLGPTLFLLAMGMLVLRLFPHLLSGLAWLSSRRRGLVLQLGLARLARNPVRPAQVILLISLAAALIYFTSAYTHSLDQAQGFLARYRAGADLRVYPANQPLQNFIDLPGVIAASPMQRIPVDTKDGSTIIILAVEPETMPLVTRYPPGMTNLTIPAVMRALSWEPPAVELESWKINPYLDAVNKNNPIPAVFSPGALGKDEDIGSVVELLFPGIRLEVSVNGTLRNFPTGWGDFIIVDRAALAQYLDLDATQFTRNKEVWLSIDPGFYDFLEQIPWLKKATKADAWLELLAMQSNAFVQGMSRAFGLNTAIVSLLSVAGLFLVHYFSARQRTYEFGVLRAEGLSAGQLLLLLGVEALMVALIGLAAGTLLGVALAEGMRTYLNLVLGRVEAGLILYQVQVDWEIVLRQYAWLVGGYLLATLLSLVMLLRAGVHRTLRIGDE
jgi:putative ABC transport system permease protein